MSNATDSLSNTIYDLSLRCLTLFRDCLAAENALAALQPYEERFWAWANQLNVFSKPHISLDAQLKYEKFRRLRQAICLLLEVLRDNLQLALKLSQDEALPTPEEQHRVSEDPPTFNPLKIPLSSIEGALKRLEKIVIIILQATQNSLARRVLAYADQARNEGYEEHVDLVLRYRFQNALSEELRKLILTSVLHRFYRIQYERKRRIHERPRWDVHEEKASEPAAKPEQLPVVSQQVATPDPPGVSQTQRPEHRSEAPTQPLTVDADVVQEKLKEGLSAPPSYKPADTASVSETGDAIYPNAPELKEGQTKATCPICLKESESHTFEGTKWRAHVDADLLPYICISDECSSKLRFFADRKSWSLHMQTEHSALWIKTLPCRAWRCPLPHTATETFSSEEELLQKHLRIVHSNLSEQRLKSMAHSGRISQPRHIDNCVICGDEHRPQNRQVDQHEEYDELSESDTEQIETQAPKAAAKSTVRFAISDDSSERIKDIESRASTSEGAAGRSSLDAVVHKRMERYIGKHLKALAFFFARNLIEEEDNSEDTSLARPRSIDDLMSIDLSEFPNPAEPPNPASRFHSLVLSKMRYEHPPQLHVRIEISQPGAEVGWSAPLSLFHDKVGGLRRHTAERFEVADPQRLRMVVIKRSDIEQSDNENRSNLDAVTPMTPKQEVPKYILMKNDDSNTRDYGLSRWGGDCEIRCDLGETPLVMSTLDEGFTDQEVIWSNWMALHHGPDMLQSSTEPNFPFWKPVNWGWSSKFSPNTFWSPELLRDISYKRSSDGLKEDTEVWRGFDPFNAYMAAADIILALELYLRLNENWNSPDRSGMEEACKEIHIILKNRIERISSQVELTEKVVLSKHTQTIKEYSSDLSAIEKHFPEMAAPGGHQIKDLLDSTLRSLRDRTLVNVCLAVLDTRNSRAPTYDRNTEVASRWIEQEQAIVRTFFSQEGLKRMPRLHERQDETYLHLSDKEENPSAQQSISLSRRTKRPIAALNTINTVREQIDIIIQKIRPLSLSKKDIDFIISRLNMPQLHFRADSIQRAYLKTLEWVYHENSFMQWLNQGSGVFWISGKPGSGKSTLMRFLTTSEAIKAALMNWADGMPLQVASAFVWGRGDFEQRSVSGIIRTLLFQLLSENDNWAAALFPSAAHTEEHRRPDFPTTRQLRDAFGLLFTQSTVQAKVALFIDGLDELDGNLHDIIAMLEFASNQSRSQVKIVVSSRPMPILLDAIPQSPSLRMQDLTKNDITLYTREMLFEASHGEGVENLNRLVDSVVERAEGSFLWVRLVVQSLCQGLEMGDSPSNLERRLNEIPSSLDEYFSYILKGIHASYHEELFIMVDLMSACEEYPYQLHPALGPDSTVLTVLDVYYFLQVIHDNELPYLLSLGLATSLSQYQLNLVFQEVRRNLERRTNGLLEIAGSNIREDHQNVPVVYMHRTLADFFRQSELPLKRPLDLVRTARILLQTTVMRFRRFNTQYELTSLSDLLGRALVFAKFLQISHSLTPDDLGMLDGLDNAIQQFVDEQRLPVNCWGSWIEQSGWFGENQFSISELDHFDLLSITTLYGLVSYVGHRVSSMEDRPSLTSRLLKYACIPKTRYSFPDGNVSVDMAAMLLRAGADPNKTIDQQTSAWTDLLARQSSLDSKLWIQLIKLLFVEGNADPWTVVAITLGDKGGDKPLLRTAYEILDNAVFETDELKAEVSHLKSLMIKRHPPPINTSSAEAFPVQRREKSLASRVRGFFGTIGQQRENNTRTGN